MINIKELIKLYRNTPMSHESMRRLKTAIIFADLHRCSIIAVLECLRNELGAMSPDAQRYADFTLAKEIFCSSDRDSRMKHYVANKMLIRACKRARDDPQAEASLKLWLMAWKQKLAKEIKKQ